MPQLTSLIIDDEPMARSIIESYIRQLGNWTTPLSCNNGIEALAILNNGFSPDVIFLDINMPIINGIDFFNTLKNPPATVLTTAHAEYAVEAFELQVIDYLVKPISFERFLKTVQRVNELLLNNEATTLQQQQKEYIFLKYNGKLQKVILADILYIEAKGDYISVCTKTQKLLISMPMKEIEEVIPQDTFIRVHRSYIVNLKRVNSIFGNTIEMEGKEIPIGLNYRDIFLKRIIDKDSDTNQY